MQQNRRKHIPPGKSPENHSKVPAFGGGYVSSQDGTPVDFKMFRLQNQSNRQGETHILRTSEPLGKWPNPSSPWHQKRILELQSSTFRLTKTNSLIDEADDDDDWWWLMMTDDDWWWLMMADDGWWWWVIMDVFSHFVWQRLAI